jgi:hypothetical protein
VRALHGLQPGHELSTRHQSYRSDVVLSEQPRVHELVEQITASQPVSHPADDGACWRLALVYRRIELAAAAIDQADEAVAGKPIAAYGDKAAWLGRLREDLDRWLRLAGRIELELGRTPTSRAKLGLHVASARRALTLAELHEAAAVEEVE